MKKQESAVLATNVVSARSLIEAAYSALREDILNGQLQPGEKLRVEALKDRYDVGASTLREALTRLVGEALVTSEEQRGFRVATVSVEDFADLTQTRKLIEIEALRQAILVGDDAWEADVVAAYHRLSKVEEKLGSSPMSYTNEFEDRNRAFHRALLSACQSRWLHHMHGMLFQQSERYRRISLAHREIHRDVHAEHQALFEAVLARDAAKACRLAGEHIDRTLQVVNKVFSVSAVK
jgi:GntR family transcriptional regulator, carbon starvation induced regulator